MTLSSDFTRASVVQNYELPYAPGSLYKSSIVYNVNQSILGNGTRIPLILGVAGAGKVGGRNTTLLVGSEAMFHLNFSSPLRNGTYQIVSLLAQLSKAQMYGQVDFYTDPGLAIVYVVQTVSLLIDRTAPSSVAASKVFGDYYCYQMQFGNRMTLIYLNFDSSYVNVSSILANFSLELSQFTSAVYLLYEITVDGTYPQLFTGKLPYDFTTYVTNLSMLMSYSGYNAEGLAPVAWWNASIDPIGRAVGGVKTPFAGYVRYSAEDGLVTGNSSSYVTNNAFSFWNGSEWVSYVSIW